MKIAHINIIFSANGMSGVEKKLADEAEYMSKQGIDLYLLGRGHSNLSPFIKYIDLDKYLSKKILPELYLRSFRCKVIEDNIDLKAYDYIILRYPLMDFSSISLSKKYKNKIITEHHTKELNEIKLLKIPYFFKISQFLFEKYGAKSFFKNIKGSIGISNDVLHELQNRVSRVDLPTFRFSNGIVIDTVYHRKKKKDTQINILAIASTFNDWHGIDRLLGSLENYNGETKILLHLVGLIKDDDIRLIDNFKNSKCVIKLHGILKSSEVKKLYQVADIGCNSLAMHRIGMHESSTLKSKEYVLNSLPFLYSAADPDLSNIKKYLFYCKPDESLIDFTGIINKYNNIDLNRMTLDFQECVNKELNWSVKISNLINWIKIL